MQSSKEQSLIATYAAMDASEIERRLRSKQLTLVATKIALAELEVRKKLQAEAPVVANSAVVADLTEVVDSTVVANSSEVAGGRIKKSKQGIVLFAVGAFVLFYFWSVFLRTGLSYRLIFTVLVIGLVAHGGNRLAIASIKDHGEADNLATRAWSSLLLVSCMVFGYLALGILPALSQHGLLQFILMFPVFFGAAGIGLGALLMIGRAVGGRGRLIVSAILLGVLYVTLVTPMNRQSEAEKKEKDARFEAKLEDNMRLMNTIAHAPPGVVPGMLDVRKDADGLNISNISDKKLWVKVALVVPYGRTYSRCSAWAEDQAKSCDTQMGKDGTETTRQCRNIRPPELAPGQTARFSHTGCPASFEQGWLEFKVSDSISSTTRVKDKIVVLSEDHLVFQSDSAFVPDIW